MEGSLPKFIETYYPHCYGTKLFKNRQHISLTVSKLKPLCIFVKQVYYQIPVKLMAIPQAELCAVLIIKQHANMLN